MVDPDRAVSMYEKVMRGDNDFKVLEPEEDDGPFEECLDIVNELIKDILDFKKAGIDVDKRFIDDAFRMKVSLIETYVQIEHISI